MQSTKGSNAELVLVANCWISQLPPKSLICLEGILNKLLMLELLLYSWRIANVDFKKQKNKSKLGNCKLVNPTVEKVLKGEKKLIV